MQVFVRKLTVHARQRKTPTAHGHVALILQLLLYHINVHLNNPVSSVYNSLIQKISQLPAQSQSTCSWACFAQPQCDLQVASPRPEIRR